MVRLDHVVLELLVGQELDQADGGRRGTVGEGDEDEERAPEEPADLRDEVGHGRPDGRQRGERDAERQSHDQDVANGEEGDQDRAGEIPAHGAVEDPG
jgi:hypothetical protein